MVKADGLRGTIRFSCGVATQAKSSGSIEEPVSIHAVNLIPIHVIGVRQITGVEWLPGLCHSQLEPVRADDRNDEITGRDIDLKRFFDLWLR